MLPGSRYDAGPANARAESLSREFVVVCDAEGIVRWADERAARLVGARTGTDLRTIAVDGTVSKVDRLLAAAREGGEPPDPAQGWELLLEVEGRPVTVAVRAEAWEGGAVLVGSVVSQDFGTMIEQMSRTMGELSALHRESERQQRELVRRQEEIDRQRGELADSSRGISALYDELADKSDSLLRVGEVKSRFIANMSHELRTPLNSIIGLAKLLMTQADGALTREQEKQIGFIRRSAESLSEIVNDMLDLATIEAGRAPLRPVKFEAAELFSALRGMMRPLRTGHDVAFVVEEPAGLPPMETDEGKLSQVLRNLVSNALKFTERGEVRVSARDAGSGRVAFTVRDTGIGIAPADQERIFEEFTQVESELQRRVKGTGLGLSIVRRYAAILGGEVTVESEPGKGSAFTVTIPAEHPEVSAMEELRTRSTALDPSRQTILVLEDDRQTLFLYEKYLEGSGFQVLPARTVEEARAHLARTRPAAMVLDVMLEAETSWTFLSEVKGDPATADIPVLVVTVMDREQKARALGADEFYVKPMDREWLLRKLRTIAKKQPVERVLVIDDDEVSRYLVRKLLADTPYTVLEAPDGPEGIRMARETEPQLILLDFVMPKMTAFDVLDELKRDPRTRNIPVIVNTSKQLTAEERERLQHSTAAVLPKDALSREVAIGRIREALEKSVPRQAGGVEQPWGPKRV
jgi:signal transduction histidine kinase/CheY-like chemotaxis protein